MSRRRIDMREKDMRRRREKELPFLLFQLPTLSSLFSKHFLHTNHHLKSSQLLKGHRK
jgi:hypothetical protein